MGLFDRNSKKSASDAPSGPAENGPENGLESGPESGAESIGENVPEDAATAATAATEAPRSRGEDENLFDAIDSVDDIDVPEATPDQAVSGQPRIREEEVSAAQDPTVAEPEVPEVSEEQDTTVGNAGAAWDAPVQDDAGDASAPEGAVGTDGTDGAVDADVPEEKPKRDIYAMTGRARPQRIEPRSAEPAAAASPHPDGSRTDVVGSPALTTAGTDPAYGADPVDDDAQNRTVAFGATGGAAGAAGAGDTTEHGAPTEAFGETGSDGAPETTVFAAGHQTAATPVEGEQEDTVGRAPEDPAVAAQPAVGVKRGTLDFGLFILRAVVGVLLAVRGLQTLFAFGGDPGISAFEQTLSAYNFADILAVAVPVVQIVAGGLLLFGLLTPVGSALTIVVSGFLFIHHLAIWDSGYWPYTLSPQVQFWAMIGLAGLVLTFTGPGRYAADISRGWATRPLASAWVFAVIGMAGAAGLWLLVGGGNPF